MTHLFLWESTDELHWTLLLPGCHGVVHGCECGVIDLDFICSVLGFGFLCNKQATFREDAFQKKIKSFIYQISFKKPVTFASATKHTYTHIKSIQHIGQIIFTSLHVGQEITWSKNFGYCHARYSGHYIHVLFLPFLREYLHNVKYQLHFRHQIHNRTYKYLNTDWRLTLTQHHKNRSIFLLLQKTTSLNNTLKISYNIPQWYKICLIQFYIPVTWLIHVSTFS